MKIYTSRTAIMAFNLPPDRPKSALLAIETYERAAQRLGALIGEHADAKEAAEIDRAARIRDAALSDKPASTADLKRKYDDKLAEIEGQIEVANERCHLTGNAMAAAVAEAREEWIATLEAKRLDAEARYTEAVKAALEALEVVRVTRGSVAWLSGFDADLATIGQSAQYHGKGRVEITNAGMGLYRGKHDAETLLRLAARVTEPEEKPPAAPRLGTQGESVFVGAAS